MNRILAALALALGLTVPVAAHAAGPTTFTVEPFDFDQVAGVSESITQDQFGGRMCPCAKIAYPADGFHNQQGADAINAATTKMHPGDTLMGFSLGVQVISLFLSQHTLPAGVHVLLAGDTYARNQQLVDQKQGIPWDIANDVTMVVNEWDGWSDAPTITTAPGFALAWLTAGSGTQVLHYYRNADPSDPGNVVTHRGNITAVLIPTLHLPQNAYLRLVGLAPTAAQEAAQREQIRTAYARPGSPPTTSTAVPAATVTAQQVPFPNPTWTNNPEPLA